MTKPKIDWVTTLFLLLTPVIAAILVPIHLYYFPLHTWTLSLTVMFWLFTGMSITAGYHRLFAHKAYTANKWVEAFVLFFGAAAFQGSALKWSTDHRRHHRKVDTNDDPYSIKKGFMYAHITWLFEKTAPEYKDVYAEDLKTNKLVWFQHKHFYTIGIFACFVLPTLLGWMGGDALGGFVWAGLVRLVIVHHGTFFINSLAHVWGSQPYSDKNTARDNGLIAFLTYGEGYHNYHHAFEADYRNGIRWWQFDPTKWAIRGLNVVGQTKDLKTMPNEVILRHRMVQQAKKLERKNTAWDERLVELQQKVELAQRRMRQLKKEMQQLKLDWSEKSQERLLALKAEFKLAKLEFKNAWNQWRVCVRTMNAMPAGV